MDGKLDKWRTRWLPAIKADLQDLVWSVGIYREVVSIVQQNPRIDRANRFYGWLGLTFAQSTTMGIRRQTDHQKDSVSLKHLAVDIFENSSSVTKKTFISLYPDEQAAFATRDWERLAGAAAMSYPAERAAEYIDRLDAVRTRIAEYADRRIAHLETREIAAVPTFRVLLESIDELHECFKHFGLLLHATSYTLDPVVQYDWKSIFREPWLDSGGAGGDEDG